MSIKSSTLKKQSGKGNSDVKEFNRQENKKFYVAMTENWKFDFHPAKLNFNMTVAIGLL